MYNPAIKENVRGLREGGLTFKEILEKFPFLGKGTISGWVRDIILTPEQEGRILEKCLNGRRGLMEYNKKKHVESIKNAQKIISEAKREIGKINKRDLTIAGSALYWAEGSKTSKYHIDFINSDPKIITLIMKFFREICQVEENKFKCALFLHPGLDEKTALNFWSEVTDVPLSQFVKTHRKPSINSKGKMHNILYKGTLRIYICDTKKICKVRGFIEGLSNHQAPIV